MMHPGTVLWEEFMGRHGLSQYRVAVDIGVPPRRINEIVLGRRGITADTALRLARYFGTEPGYWMSIQAAWELEQTAGRLGRRLESQVKVFDPRKPPPRRGRPPRIPEGVAAPKTRPRSLGMPVEADHLFFD
mgnify:CR=1 FL=1